VFRFRGTCSEIRVTLGFCNERVSACIQVASSLSLLSPLASTTTLDNHGNFLLLCRCRQRYVISFATYILGRCGC
jgi:hypothetical protein